MRDIMAKKNDITVSEMRALLPWFLAVNAVYFALLLVPVSYTHLTLPTSDLV